MDDSRRPPPASAAFVDHYLAYLLARASKVVSGRFHAVLKENGLSIGEWRVLAAVNDVPQSISKLAEIILEQQPTASRLVARMAAAGLVTREPDPADRRIVYVTATARGKERAAPLLALAQQFQDEALAPFGEARAEDLLGMLRALINGG